MDRIKYLCIAAAMVVAILLSGVLANTARAQQLGCSATDVLTGGCSVDASIGADEVTLSGSATDSGSSAGGGSGGTSGRGSASGKVRPSQCETIVAGHCLVRMGRPGPDQPAPAVVVQPITLREIANFHPVPGRQLMEPNGWVAPGLDANFYSIVGQQLVDGSLLGRSATVRFTPVAWHWNYGDGTGAVRPTQGATWASQGLTDFDPTPTSHVYEAEGEYTIRLSIDFHAEYRFGGAGFVPIPGTINLPANDLHVTVTGAKTVLVEHDCAANPAGPGC